MKILIKTALLFGIQFLFSCNDSSKSDFNPSLKLWYNEPASSWEEALPLGNGRLGVMVFGNPSNERIQLNEDSMWSGGPDRGHFRVSFYDVLRTIKGKIVAF